MNLNKSFGGDDTKAKEWMEKHPSLTGAIFVLLLIVFYSLLGGSDNNSNLNIATTSTNESVSTETSSVTKVAPQESNKKVVDTKVGTTKTAPAKTTTASAPVVSPTPTTTPTPVPSQTVSQKNAVAKAKSYLGYSAFSHDGLVAQLEFEQFSHTDAVYGADNSGANWNEQAAKKAKSYMEYSAFSRGSLIAQLEYDKFTKAQAEYGASAVGL